MTSLINSGQLSLNQTPRNHNSQKEYNNSIKIQESTRKKHQKHHRKNRSLIVSTKREFQDPIQHQKQTQKVKEKLVKNNFAQHDPNLCVCSSCECGRHMCNLHNVKPDLTKYSVYAQNFSKRAPIPNKINISKEYDKLKGDHIGMNSNYLKSYQGFKGDALERPKPQDLLKTGGPSPNLTSYTSGFPGYKGSNQYIKPKDNQTRANFPLRAKSTYSKSFENRGAPKPQKQKIADNLKSTSLWLGRSTYKNFYEQPNPQDYPTKVKNIQKLEKNPRFLRQYETTYKHSFIPDDNNNQEKVSPQCPSKKKIETIAKGVFNKSKDKFAENSDFKSLNPAYHSLSTSKHFYV